jgi:dihydrofolate reductase
MISTASIGHTGDRFAPRRRTMGKVLTHMTMSLDGFIADPGDQVGELFEWYEAGDVAVPSANEDVTFAVDDASAGVLSDLTMRSGALVSGRRLFDMTDGWGDHHPAGAPVVVVTHHPPTSAAERWPRTTFVDDVTTAVTEARKIAGDAHVTIMSPDIIRQALELDLVDEVCVSVVPVLFGEGIPYFAKLTRGHVMLEDPVVVQGRRALHLRYLVRR